MDGADGFRISRLHIPQPKGAIANCRNEPLTVTGEGEDVIVPNPRIVVGSSGVWMAFELHLNALVRQIPHLDAVVFGDRGEQVRVAETQDGVLDSILIFEQ